MLLKVCTGLKGSLHRSPPAFCASRNLFHIKFPWRMCFSCCLNVSEAFHCHFLKAKYPGVFSHRVGAGCIENSHAIGRAENNSSINCQAPGWMILPPSWHPRGILQTGREDCFRQHHVPMSAVEGDATQTAACASKGFGKKCLANRNAEMEAAINFCNSCFLNRKLALYKMTWKKLSKLLGFCHSPLALKLDVA